MKIGYNTLLLLMVLSSTLLGQGFNYLPNTAIKGVVVKHSNYTLMYSETHEQALWVAYHLTREEVSGSVSRSNDFRIDPSVSTGSATLADYKGSGYDRGHLAPAADMDFSTTAMSESFYMSNMSPQSPGFNRGAWKNVEALVRSWAVKYGEVWIATGGDLNTIKGSIGPNQVSIPNYYYKAVLIKVNGQWKGIAFYMPNQKCYSGLESYALSIDRLEAKLNIDFFPGLEDSIENSVESSLSVASFQWTSTSTYKSTTTAKKSTTTSKGTSNCKYRQCNATAKSTGNRCKRCVSSSADYKCYQHK